uniref:PAN2-PAN3 deadenylation complex catalytic subunit PAN2 n=1 Tax=Phallusia mammillata TaxID=59560 RepID=A0A6F9DNT3_9ASCI|nr:PAB-dependent poly(A)-specific ribonuclease subunit PAN2 [Phallusia mammillata]
MFTVGGSEYPAPTQHAVSNVGQIPIVGEYLELNVLPIDGAPQFGASAVHFDSSFELLWVGNQHGHVTSYYGPTNQKYTSFQVHPSNPVVEILTIGDRILSLTKNSLRCSLNRGVTQFEFTNDILQNTQCMSLRKDSNILLGGKNTALIEYDINTETMTKKIALTDDQATAIFRSTSKFLCCGTYNGKVILRDSDSLQVVRTLDAHTGTLSDFDANGHLLITCGFSQRSGSSNQGSQHLSLDPFVKVYDLRMMRSLSPIQCVVQPSFLRFLSTYTRRMLVMSQAGQFLLIEDNAAITPTTPIYQANLMAASIVNLDISRSMQAIAFVDSGGCLHMWSASANPTFNKFQKDPQFPDVAETLDSIDIDNEMTPLSVIAMPYCQEPLLSDWPQEYCVPVSRRPPPINPELLRSMKVVQGIGYAPNPGNRKRNQVPYKLKDISLQDAKGKKAAVPDSPLGRDEQPHLFMVPKKYRKVIFKYSKLGYEENEMIQHYNKTNFPGLDPNIPNAYCNCMLQVLYFIEPLRCGLQSHHNLNKEFDLAEELGFLFFMQDSATSGVLLASNFLRAFRTIPEATALGLLQNSNKSEQLSTGGSSNLGHLIQNWNRFILQQLHSETIPVNKEESSDVIILDPDELEENIDSKNQRESSSEPKSLIDKLFGSEMKISTQFRNGRTTERKTSQFLFNLTFPSVGKPGEPPKYVPFSTIIRNSICSQVHTKSWDEVSETYQPMIQTKTPCTLPDILALNCSLMRDENFHFWKVQTELFSEKMEKKLEESRSRRTSNVDSQKTTQLSSSDAWNVFAEREGLDFSFERNSLSGWVPLNLKMSIKENQELVVQSDNDWDEPKEATENLEFVEYELYCTVAHVNDPRTGGNLVAHINVGKTFHQRKEGVTHTQWYLFNDFQISAIDKEESVDFDLKWKVPCVFYYMRKDINERHKIQINFPLTSKILLPTPSISKGRHRLSSSVEPRSPPAAMTFTPLLPHEVPTKPGMLIALDAEFVTLNAEEAELHSDGTRSTIKPSHLLVARITVVRGEGDEEGSPFIDDYISTQEQVVDYLTKFSGIKPGDLDASISSKHLSTLKLTYCKLRYLVQCGCVIVGHGLSKDFKVINIFVPDDQVHDTVHLFHKPRKRYISLRFLAWYFLGEKIQKDMHDSIEDARTALKLYKKYLELTDHGKNMSEFTQNILNKLYEEGRRLEWKVPEDGAV